MVQRRHQRSPLQSVTRLHNLLVHGPFNVILTPTPILPNQPTPW